MSDATGVEPGLPADLSTLTFDLPTIFRESVDLAESLNLIAYPFELSRNADVLRFRLIRAMNPRDRKLSPHPDYPKTDESRSVCPGWGQEIAFSPHLSADARRALIALALLAADLGVDDVDPVAFVKTMLPYTVITLWAGMTGADRLAAPSAEAKALVVFKRQSLPLTSPSILIDFGSPGRVIDSRNWRTRVVLYPERDGPCLEHNLIPELGRPPVTAPAGEAPPGEAAPNGDGALPADIAAVLRDHDERQSEVRRVSEYRCQREVMQRHLIALGNRVRGALSLIPRLKVGEGPEALTTALQAVGLAWRNYQTAVLTAVPLAGTGPARAETTLDLVCRVSSDARLPAAARLFLRLLARSIRESPELPGVVRILFENRLDDLQAGIQWLPFFRDHLFQPDPDVMGIIHVAETPPGLTREEDDAVFAALGFTKLMPDSEHATQSAGGEQNQFAETGKSPDLTDHDEPITAPLPVETSSAGQGIPDGGADKNTSIALSARSIAQPEKPVQGPTPDPEPDGPRPPSRFVWSGKTTTLTTIPWKLLKCMWDDSRAGHSVRAVHIDRLDSVWEAVPTPDAVSAAVFKVNRGLKGVYPFRIEFRNSYVSWVRTEA